MAYFSFLGPFLLTFGLPTPTACAPIIIADIVSDSASCSRTPSHLKVKFVSNNY